MTAFLLLLAVDALILVAGIVVCFIGILESYRREGWL